MGCMTSRRELRPRIESASMQHTKGVIAAVETGVQGIRLTAVLLVQEDEARHISRRHRFVGVPNGARWEPPIHTPVSDG